MKKLLLTTATLVTLASSAFAAPALEGDWCDDMDAECKEILHVDTKSYQAGHDKPIPWTEKVLISGNNDYGIYLITFLYDWKGSTKTRKELWKATKDKLVIVLLSEESLQTGAPEVFKRKVK